MAITTTAKYFTKGKNLSATSGGASGDIIYTCPNNFISLVKLIFVSNGATSAKKYSLQWYESATTTYHSIVDEVSLAASTNEKVIEGGAFIALAAGDEIVGFEESSSDFHVILSGEEHYQPT